MILLWIQALLINITAHISLAESIKQVRSGQDVRVKVWQRGVKVYCSNKIMLKYLIFIGSLPALSSVVTSLCYPPSSKILWQIGIRILQVEIFTMRSIYFLHLFSILLTSPFCGDSRCLHISWHRWRLVDCQELPYKYFSTVHFQLTSLIAMAIKKLDPFLPMFCLNFLSSILHTPHFY